jgi:hypothetical protein
MSAPISRGCCGNILQVLVPIHQERLVTVTDLVDRLAGHRTLGSAPVEELTWLASHGSLRHLNEGEVLTAKGTAVYGLFVVLTGTSLFLSIVAPGGKK